MFWVFVNIAVFLFVVGSLTFPFGRQTVSSCHSELFITYHKKQTATKQDSSINPYTD